MIEEQANFPQASVVLKRLPKRRRELLRAWDAADEYLLNHLNEQQLPVAGSRVAIVNDSFGALAVTLAEYAPTAISDSWLSQAATRMNLQENGLADSAVTLLSALDELQGEFDLVLIKVPKTLALLEHQLIELAPHLTPTSQLIFAGMVKLLPSSVWKLIERLVGPTTTSLAKKKAKLIIAQPDGSLKMPENPYPHCYTLEGSDYRICNHANVFSRDSLDIGTRFFLQHLPQMPEAKEIVDLGCGNGVVGLIAAEKNPQASIHFVDESFMAVASAQQNFETAFGDSRSAQFSVGDGLEEFAVESVDLILCNPPFHQQQAVGDQIAMSMFRESKRVLRRGGELWVIGNRHLGYHTTLKRLFGRVQNIESNEKFVILRVLQS
nr:methyltransferase [Candidatus Reidiella endopervernicosa]